MKIENFDKCFNHLKINGIKTAQNPNIIPALKELNIFLKNNNIIISDIIEIGTLRGGFTTLLTETNPTIKIHTFDIQHPSSKPFNSYPNVFFYNEDVFVTNTIKELLKKSTHNCLVFCDGGDKIKEFNTFVEFLKPNDFIFCHDYIKNKKTFEEEFLNKIWNWHESNFDSIKLSIEKFKLENILAEHFEPAVWASYKKPNE